MERQTRVCLTYTALERKLGYFSRWVLNDLSLERTTPNVTAHSKGLERATPNVGQNSERLERTTLNVMAHSKRLERAPRNVVQSS